LGEWYSLISTRATMGNQTKAKVASNLAGHAEPGGLHFGSV